MRLVCPQKGGPRRPGSGHQYRKNFSKSCLVLERRRKGIYPKETGNLSPFSHVQPPVAAVAIEAHQDPKTLRKGKPSSVIIGAVIPRGYGESLFAFSLLFCYLALDMGTVVGNAHQRRINKAPPFQSENRKGSPRESEITGRSQRRSLGKQLFKLFMNSPGSLSSSLCVDLTQTST